MNRIIKTAAIAATTAIALAACGSDGTSVSESAVVTESPAPDETTAETTETTAETETTEPATTVAETETTEPATTVAETEETDSPDELTSIAKSGFSTYESIGETWASAGALVVNNSDEDLFGTEVTFNFIGADGTPVGTESTYIDVIPAGDSFPAITSISDDLTAAMPVTMEVTVFAEEDSFMATDWIEMDLGPTTIVTDEYFSKVTGTVTNPSDAPIDFFEVSCLIVTADGTVVGGSYTYPDTVAPGQTIAWESSVDDGPLQAGGVATECRSIATITE